MIKNIQIVNTHTIRAAMALLEKNTEKCLIVVDKNNRFYSTLTDGDIRRAILKGSNLETTIKDFIKKKKSLTISEKIYKNSSLKEIKKIIEKFPQKKINLIPILDNNKRVIDYIENINSKSSNEKLKKIPLIIMAGGKGLRLKPFTNIFPKPLIPVNNIPAAEHIINKFLNDGLKKIFISVNFKKDLIKSYFKDKTFNLNFIEEKKEMGTIGSLGYLKNKIKTDFIVSNCDTIVKIDTNNLYEYHKKNNSYLTIVVATKNFQMPYGSCLLDNRGKLKKIDEKPNFDYLVNTGLYIMRPEILNFINKNQRLDFDQLIKKLKLRKKQIGIFPISENNWTDVGKWSDYNKLILNHN